MEKSLHVTILKLRNIKIHIYIFAPHPPHQSEFLVVTLGKIHSCKSDQNVNIASDRDRRDTRDTRKIKKIFFVD